MANSNWKQLKPFRGTEYSHWNLNSHHIILFKTESQSMIAVPQQIPTWTGLKDGIRYESIHKYSFCDTSWKEYKCNIQSTKASNEQRLTFPKAIHKEKIYANTNKCEIAMVKLIDEISIYTIEIIQKVNELKPARYGQGIIIEEELHLLKWYRTDSRYMVRHTKYNLDTQRFSLIPIAGSGFRRNTNLIRVKQKLITFVSRFNKNWAYHYMYEYNLKTRHSQCFPINLSQGRYCVSCTSILNEQMILITMNSKIIYIYEVKTKIVQKSNMNVLCNQSIFAVKDRRKDILVTYGWIRSTCTNIYVPACITALIEHFFTNEYLHIINDDAEHYKIEVHRILNNC